jgi:predicted membrane-bound mannosyltransferase
VTRRALAGVLLALMLGAWLRIHGLDIQVVQDDEWHAIHKLMTSTYGEIFRTFGFADHSIPLTLFYKAMAESIGLDEIVMRALQVVCGIALIGVCAVLAWRATASPVITVLFAFLIAGAPFLVFYSRYARPYAITTLLSVLVLAALWRWRGTRTTPLAAAICIGASLAAWLHPLAALYPMAALLFILAEDLQDARWRVAAAGTTIALGAAVGVAIAAPLAIPFLNDVQSLAAKAGDSTPTLYTFPMPSPSSSRSWRAPAHFASSACSRGQAASS